MVGVLERVKGSQQIKSSGDGGSADDGNKAGEWVV